MSTPYTEQRKWHGEWRYAGGTYEITASAEVKITPDAGYYRDTGMRTGEVEIDLEAMQLSVTGFFGEQGEPQEIVEGMLVWVDCRLFAARHLTAFDFNL